MYSPAGIEAAGLLEAPSHHTRQDLKQLLFNGTSRPIPDTAVRHPDAQVDLIGAPVTDLDSGSVIVARLNVDGLLFVVHDQRCDI
jgi:hypothetical protein